MINWFKKTDTGKFRTEREGERGKTREVVYLLCAAFFVIATFWFLFFSKFFNVTNYEIQPLAVLHEDAVKGEINGYFSQNEKWPWGNRNIFTVNTEELKNYLLGKFFVQNVTVDKKYPNILRLKIWERQRSVVLVSKNQIYIVDDYGVISDIADDTLASTTRNYLTSSTPLETSKEIYVVTPTTTSFIKGQTITTADNVRSWLDLSSKLRDAGIWFKALRFDQAMPNLITVILKENKDVIMDLTIALDGQIDTLRQFLLTKPKFEDIHEYIDVRIPGRIYYK